MRRQKGPGGSQPPLLTSLRQVPEPQALSLNRLLSIASETRVVLWLNASGLRGPLLLGKEAIKKANTEKLNPPPIPPPPLLRLHLKQAVKGCLRKL